MKVDTAHCKNFENLSYIDRDAGLNISSTIEKIFLFLFHALFFIIIFFLNKEEGLIKRQSPEYYGNNAIAWQ